MKFTLPVIAFTASSLLPSALAVPDNHAAALRIFRRTAESSALQTRSSAVPQGLFKRQLNQCVDSGYVACPASDFCCPLGLTCIEGGWCGDEELTTCYQGEDDCGTHCCQVGYECIPNSDYCKPIGGSSTSTSNSNGVDTTRKKNTKAGGTSGTNSVTAPLKNEAGKGAGSVILAGAGVLVAMLVL